MTHTNSERIKRQERLEAMRRQIAAGELVVRKMTAAERALWNARSEESARYQSPEELARRKANAAKRARIQSLRRARFDEARGGS